MEKFLIIIASICFISGVFCSGTRPSNLGIKDGELSPCPDSPNCASSQAKDSEHHIAPFKFNGNGKDAIKKLISIIKSLKRTNIISSSEDYIHAEFTSFIFRFVDDVEFYLNNDEKVIHVRSASRIGYSDIGVNRKRIEMIRKKFIAI